MDFGAECAGRPTRRHLVVDPSDTRLAVHARLISLPQKIARLGFRSVDFQGPLATDFGDTVEFLDATFGVDFIYGDAFDFESISSWTF